MGLECCDGMDSTELAIVGGDFFVEVQGRVGREANMMSVARSLVVFFENCDRGIVAVEFISFRGFLVIWGFFVYHEVSMASVRRLRL